MSRAQVALSFDSRVLVQPNGCWLWSGYIDRKGYGVMGVGGKNLVRVHRYSYERFVKPIPAGLHIDHLCRVRNCVNPRHLEPVTNRENVIRGVLARPAKSACKHGHDYTEENTYINPSGNRECRICRTAAVSRHLAQKEKAIGTRS